MNLKCGGPVPEKDKPNKQQLLKIWVRTCILKATCFFKKTKQNFIVVLHSLFFFKGEKCISVYLSPQSYLAPWSHVFQTRFPRWLNGKESACQCRRPRFHPLEEGMATHSSILAWKIPWTEEPGGLQSMGSQRDTTEHAHISDYLCWKTFYLSWTSAFIKYNKRNLLLKWNKHEQNTYKALIFLLMRSNKYFKFLSIYFACLFLQGPVVNDF